MYLAAPNRNRNKPVLIKDDERSKEWFRIVCGGDHTVLVTTSGDVYACGPYGEYGQLGNGEEKDSNKPKPIKSLAENIDVVEASCGSTHTAVVTRAGHLYTWYV